MQHQTTATVVAQCRADIRCPECGYPGAHRLLGRGWLECGNYYRTRVDEHTWLLCGATWRLPVCRRGFDEVTERVIDLLDQHDDVAVADTRCGGAVLTWETTLDLARYIAADPQLAALIRQREMVGAA
ncbi:MAG: hypothetical protein JO272_01155 [Pseudonocardiales bacterium]|nr:hypothetical protein [Pseudonocardiales bacterium]